MERWIQSASFDADDVGRPFENDERVCHTLQRLVRGRVGGNGIPRPFTAAVRSLIAEHEARPDGSDVSREFVFKNGPYNITVTRHGSGEPGGASLRVSVRRSSDYVDLSPLKKHGFAQREIEILTYLQQGHTLESIASVLGCSRETVKYHLKGLAKRLDAAGRIETLSKAVALCVRGEN